MSNGIFKCADCGEKYNHSMASVNDVALCKWCDTVELERNACEEDLESLGEDRPLSAYGKSIAEQSDREVQQEHWHSDRFGGLD